MARIEESARWVPGRSAEGSCGKVGGWNAAGNVCMLGCTTALGDNEGFHNEVNVDFRWKRKICQFKDDGFHIQNLIRNAGNVGGMEATYGATNPEDSLQAKKRKMKDYSRVPGSGGDDLYRGASVEGNNQADGNRDENQCSSQSSCAADEGDTFLTPSQSLVLHYLDLRRIHLQGAITAEKLRSEVLEKDLALINTSLVKGTKKAELQRLMFVDYDQDRPHERLRAEDFDSFLHSHESWLQACYVHSQERQAAEHKDRMLNLALDHERNVEHLRESFVEEIARTTSSVTEYGAALLSSAAGEGLRRAKRNAKAQFTR